MYNVNHFWNMKFINHFEYFDDHKIEDFKNFTKKKKLTT